MRKALVATATVFALTACGSATTEPTETVETEAAPVVGDEPGGSEEGPTCGDFSSGIGGYTQRVLVIDWMQEKGVAPKGAEWGAFRDYYVTAESWTSPDEVVDLEDWMTSRGFPPDSWTETDSGDFAEDIDYWTQDFANHCPNNGDILLSRYEPAEGLDSGYVDRFRGRLEAPPEADDYRVN